MNKIRDWQEEVWRIKKEISEETRNMSTEKYWAYIKRIADDFLKGVAKPKRKLIKT
ncbi:MAG: hypothetical protein ACPL28_03660 [bacterium]